MKNRSTIDIVVIILSSTVGIVLVLSCIGVLILRIARPEADVSRGAEAIGGMMTTMIGALVGFVGGRAQGKYEASNGKDA